MTKKPRNNSSSGPRLHFTQQNKKNEFVFRSEKPQRQRRSFSFFAMFSVVVFVCGILLYGGYYFFKVSQATQNIFTGTSHYKPSLLQTFSDIAQPPIPHDLRGYDAGRINILLLGKAGTEKKGADLTDTIMLASVDLTSMRVALFSIPRDLLVQTSNGAYTKINSLYARSKARDEGAEDITDAVEEITGQSIHYYLVMDFEGFTEIVDALDGINIDVPRTIHDERYPGPGYSYETFHIEQGFHNLDGATALKYARSRHDDPESDFGRAKRQQQILRAIRNKALSLGTLANPFTVSDILTSLSDHIDTNIASYEIRAFIDLGKKLDTHNITTIVLDAWKADSLLISTRKHGPTYSLAGLSPRTGSWDEIQEYAEHIFNLPKITARREEIRNEKPRIYLINASNSQLVAKRIEALLANSFFDITTITTTQEQSRSYIVDYTSVSKPFSFDELVNIVTPTTHTSLPEDLASFLPPQKNDTLFYDFAVVLGTDLHENFLYEETSAEEIDDTSKID